MLHDAWENMPMMAIMASLPFASSALLKLGNTLMGVPKPYTPNLNLAWVRAQGSF